MLKYLAAGPVQYMVIPAAVQNELCCDANLPDARCLRLALEDGWIEGYGLVDETDALAKLRLFLDPELEGLCRAGYRLSAQLIDEVLRLAGELGKDVVYERSSFTS